MNKYLMAVRKFFGGDTEFVVEAENKKDAINRGTKHVEQSEDFWGGNWDYTSVRCVKKLQTKKGKTNAS